MDEQLVEADEKIQRKNLLAAVSCCVDSLREYGSIVDESCEKLETLCVMIEACLLHGLILKRKGISSYWNSKTYDTASTSIIAEYNFWEFFTIVCQSFQQNCVTNISNMSNIKTPRGKGRVFIKIALMEKRLGIYLDAANTRFSSLIKEFYSVWAFLRSEECIKLKEILSRLAGIDLNFALKDENCDQRLTAIFDYAQFLEVDKGSNSGTTTPDSTRSLIESPGNKSTTHLSFNSGKVENRSVQYRGPSPTLKLKKKLPRNVDSSFSEEEEVDSLSKLKKSITNQSSNRPNKRVMSATHIRIPEFDSGEKKKKEPLILFDQVTYLKEQLKNANEQKSYLENEIELWKAKLGHEKRNVEAIEIERDELIQKNRRINQESSTKIRRLNEQLEIFKQKLQNENKTGIVLLNNNDG